MAPDLAGQFTFFVLLSRHEDFTLDGVQFDRRKVGWLIPERSFHAFARRPLTALSVTISGDRVFSWLSNHPTNADACAAQPKFRKVCRARGRGVRSTGRSDFCLGKGLVNRPVAVRQQRGRLGTRWSEPYSKRFSRAMTKSRLVVRSSTDRAVLESALEVIESGTDEPINSEDLCQAAGVSERTLRNVFYRNFGISPHRYLMLEKLHRARVALHEARPGDTVSSICANLGLWDAGRFAARYRHLFGVLPSQDLAMHRPSPARQASNGAISGPALAAHRYSSHEPGPL